VIIDIDLPSAHPTEAACVVRSTVESWFDGVDAPATGQPVAHRYQLRHGEDAERALQPEQVATFVARHLDAIGEGHLKWTPV